MVPNDARLDVPAVSQRHRAALELLTRSLDGDVRADDVHRVLYATDASLYEVVPVGVAMPRTADDLATIVEVCRAHDLPITARTAGTSLAGQTVGPGLIVDVGRYMTAIVRVDVDRRRAWVQPGVIRDDLNRHLAPHGLLFGPDTSTSNRCMLGGMIGNNSAGSHSIRYGTTRDRLASLDVLFIDGTRATVGRTSRAEWQAYEARTDRLGAVARTLRRVVGAHVDAIRAAYPREDIIRRNTGYPLDDLANSWLGDNPDRDPDLARFLAGTEGTLALTVSAELMLDPVSPCKRLVVAHFESLDASMRATVEAVKQAPTAVELMDKRILDLSALNREQARNRWFLEGDPGALLVIEVSGDSDADVDAQAERMVGALKAAELGYAYPIIAPPHDKSVWELRKAGLGVLFGKPGDVKPVTLVEDTAVSVVDLPNWVRDFAAIMAEHDTECVYYAHASVGELHLRPELNFKDPADIARGKSIGTAVADLVKKYRGALSGEHGDGRLRSPWLARVLGDDIIALHAEVKAAFDPSGLMNPGNIVDPAAFESDWRLHPDYRPVELDSEFSYEAAGGMQRAVERCNGAGVCRRPHTAGGTMCPSYMATLEEEHSTRGRANLFRRLIQLGPDAMYTSTELRDALDLCLSCKGCTSDCPANVDMATLKAEFEQGWIDRNGSSLARWTFANVTELSRPVGWLPGVSAAVNAIQRSGTTGGVMKRLMGVAPQRALPAFSSTSLSREAKRVTYPVPSALGRVALYADEFTQRYEVELGVAAIELLQAGGYDVVIPPLGPSGRTWLSKGYVREARRRIEANIRALHSMLGEVDAIVGIEPSAVLTMVDEALDLPRDEALRTMARAVAERVKLVDAFVADAAARGAWRAAWTDRAAEVVLHGHCHQKALVGTAATRAALSLPPNYVVREIPSGCCGMAGSFGYAADHYDLSMSIGELVLFPAVREASSDVLLVAPGTSCRHQIADGTGREARHPVEVLREALADGAMVSTRGA